MLLAKVSINFSRVIYCHGPVWFCWKTLVNLLRQIRSFFHASTTQTERVKPDLHKLEYKIMYKRKRL